MTWLSPWLDTVPAQTVAHSLAWTLVHFLWQGALVAGLVAILLRLTARSEAQVRHAICLAGLVSLALLPIVTYATVSSSQWLAAARSPAPFLLGDALTAAPTMAAWMPLVCVAWALGAGLFQLRAVVQLIRARDLSRRGAEPAPAWVVEMVEGLRRRLDLPRPIQVMSSAVATVPAVIGWLSPVVLIPLGALDTLLPEQLRAVLAHELAHVRRHDYLINLFQLLLESTLFFHPAVWWIGARLRDEREYCCDDLAVGACGDPLTFARALSTLDALRKPGPRTPATALPVSSQGGSLLKRITRLVDQTPRRPTGLLVSSTLAALMFSTVAASGAVAALCDDVCLVEAVTIRDGLTVINTDGHEADCTLLLAREDDGRMKVRCIDHIMVDKVHQSHAVVSLRLKDLGLSEQPAEAHAVVDLWRNLGDVQDVVLEIVEEPVHGITGEVLLEGELHDNDKNEVIEYIILEARDSFPIDQCKELHRLVLRPDERHITVDLQPHVRHYEAIVEGEHDDGDSWRQLGETEIDVGEYELLLQVQPTVQRLKNVIRPEAGLLLELAPRLLIQRILPLDVELIDEDVPLELTEPQVVIEGTLHLDDA